MAFNISISIPTKLPLSSSNSNGANVVSVAILYVFASPVGASSSCPSCVFCSGSSGVAEPLPQAASPITIVNDNAIAVTDLKNFIFSHSPLSLIFFIIKKT